jgi:hypothetical protein
MLWCTKPVLDCMWSSTRRACQGYSTLLCVDIGAICVWVIVKKGREMKGYKVATLAQNKIFTAK